jgi:hypothetical protein
VLILLSSPKAVATVECGSMRSTLPAKHCHRWLRLAAGAEALEAGREFRPFCSPWRAQDNGRDIHFDGAWRHPEWRGKRA